MKNLEKLLKALANKRRLEILKSLKKEPGDELSVGEIAEKIKLSFKATSRHLRILFEADILDKEQRNIQVFYHIDFKGKLVKYIVSIL
ncbi:MAG: ArsR family transcriptional regulator [Candidatus Giovannonibacteria bacterium GW2011_GWA2_44_13b]|uniref:ArsR family transcriptional regulator n=2 Tax=Candidatus Giovannoniibacteriota TaxID=1752738 RepID=A0A0G1J8X3_9BACT|nr:MAG: ArsR family transcriptional regulator [Candidatus Giovannonibacteria bacterium GW2011_GWA2_44_13b]OGF82947.1 MAG: hypothetical protein A2924_03050 [Candidatus Giovannonibacteria bacterium RIFCSPLOWO2_01_FULL_44_16]